MRRLMVGGMAFAMVFLLSGCGDSPDSVMKDRIKLMNEMADIMETVKDKESAERARPELEALAKKSKELEERAKKLKMNDLSKEKKEALQKKYKAEIAKVAARMMGILPKLRDPEIAKVLQDVDLQMK